MRRWAFVFALSCLSCAGGQDSEAAMWREFEADVTRHFHAENRKAFDRLDGDRSGALSRQEAPETVDFDQLDRNRDQQLAFDEYSSDALAAIAFEGWRSATLTMWESLLDPDKSGDATVEELKALGQAGTYDTDRDGRVTLREFARGMQHEATRPR